MKNTKKHTLLKALMSAVLITATAFTLAACTQAAASETSQTAFSAQARSTSAPGEAAGLSAPITCTATEIALPQAGGRALQVYEKETRGIVAFTSDLQDRFDFIESTGEWVHSDGPLQLNREAGRFTQFTYDAQTDTVIGVIPSEGGAGPVFMKLNAEGMLESVQVEMLDRLEAGGVDVEIERVDALPEHLLRVSYIVTAAGTTEEGGILTTEETMLVDTRTAAVIGMLEMTAEDEIAAGPEGILILRANGDILRFFLAGEKEGMEMVCEGAMEPGGMMSLAATGGGEFYMMEGNAIQQVDPEAGPVGEWILATSEQDAANFQWLNLVTRLDAQTFLLHAHAEDGDHVYLSTINAQQ